ncbi:hypothetical protein D3C79_1071610 [compost metagenome]
MFAGQKPLTFAFHFLQSLVELLLAPLCFVAFNIQFPMYRLQLLEARLVDCALLLISGLLSLQAGTVSSDGRLGIGGQALG